MAKKIYTEEEARQRKNERQREYAKRTGYEAQRKYLEENSKRYSLRFTITTDSDIIERLEKLGNKKTEYIRKLIRADIARDGK